jgi:hypothetical protein
MASSGNGMFELELLFANLAMEHTHHGDNSE